MDLRLSVDDEVLAAAQTRDELMGTSVEQLAGCLDAVADAEEFARLSRMAQGDSKGWKFDREWVWESR